MTYKTREITGGVDTHSQTHHAAVLDALGRELADREFPATAAGYRALLDVAAQLRGLARVGVEGTGSYGAGLARHLHAAGIVVVEVDRPDRRTRRARGKSDPIDAYAAARAALAGTRTVVPEGRGRDRRGDPGAAGDPPRRGQGPHPAINQLKALLVTAPAEIREHARGLRRRC